MFTLIWAIVMTVAFLLSFGLHMHLLRKWETERWALEQGVIELGESYEAEELDLRDKLDAKDQLNQRLASDILDRDEIIEHHAQYCHDIVEDTFELVKFRLRQKHPEKDDLFHEHDSFFDCAEGCPNPDLLGVHVYFDQDIDRRPPR